MSDHPVRVRFAPAPSGWLHVGSARTALYNWLQARGSGGAFVLRIEDTDAERVTEESYRGILDAFRFLGLDWDEGPEVGGPYGPYRQSERRALHAAVVRRLVAAGHAYEAFETEAELAAQRDQAKRDGAAPGYAGGHRTLTADQRAAFTALGRVPVVRLRTPDDGVIAFDDVVRGRVEIAWETVADFVVARADGSPTYYLANTVDDLAMGIDFVARGEDLLSATPRQILLADRLLDAPAAGGGEPVLGAALAEVGFAARPADAGRPLFAHMPLLVGEDRKPLSKRHGSVAVDEFRRTGYLPETLVNFLALLGWSYDATTERFTVAELIERFSFDRVGKTPAFFDTAKLRAMNGDRIKELSDAELADLLVPAFVTARLVADPPTRGQGDLLERLAPLLRERIQVLGEAVDLVAFCFSDDIVYDDAAVAKHLKGRAGEVLDAAAEALGDVDWNGEAIEQALRALAERLGLGLGKTMQPVRVAVAGTAVSPPLPQTLSVLDRGLVLDRIAAARPLVADA